jgi:cell wall-associated NlpC family hydrolase
MLKWRPVRRATEIRIWDVMQSWCGTPYIPGQRSKQSGVDCVQLVAGVLDELYRKGRTNLPRFSPDQSQHGSEPAVAVVKALREAYPCHRVDGDEVEPGDIIVVRTRCNPSGPPTMGHTMIASPTPGMALEAVPLAGVTYGSVESTTGILAIYRMEDKHLWA